MTSAPVPNANNVIDRQMAAALEWDRLVGKAREFDRSFLRPATAASVLPAARSGPVVVINVTAGRSDALLVRSTGVDSLRLPGLDAREAIHRTLEYLTASWSEMDGVLNRVLEWLWDVVAEPILSALGFTDRPADQGSWPRMWWCPTGPLTLLPLHAAGRYTSSGAATVLDRVVSSYTPTLRALLSSPDTAQVKPTPPRMLVVALPETPGQANLPGVNRERDLLVDRFGDDRTTVLHGVHATRDAVQRNLPLHRWVHFSCHGTQELDSPSEGGLLLHDGRLPIKEFRTREYRGEFAALSACKTAAGGVSLLDEWVTLAAALTYAGYRHVVGTLWSVGDGPALRFFELVYNELCSGSTFAADRSAFAVRNAVEVLRADAPTRPSLWSPFIHMGP
jgi:hypothetical protein